jgi:multiple sugar transport system permease protein
MSVLTRIERRSLKGRGFQAVVLLCLIAGGMTMLYPFLIMLAGSLRSEMDAAEMTLLPRYFYDDTALTRKFLEVKYHHSVSSMNELRGHQDFSFAQASVPEQIVPRRIEDLCQFVDETTIPLHWWILGGTNMHRRTTSENKHRLVERVYQAYDGNLRALSEDLGLLFRRWRDVEMRMPDWTSPRFSYQPSPFFQAYFKLLEDRPLAERAFVCLTGAFATNIVLPKYGKSSIEDYNRAHVHKVTSYEDLALPARCPSSDQPTLREEWIAFVQEMLNVSFVRADVSEQQYTAFLRRQYGDIAQLNQAWNNTSFDSFDQIRIPGDRQWIQAAQRLDWRRFIQSLDPEQLYLVGPQYVWVDWLAAKYGSLEAVRSAHEADYTAWSDIDIPMDQLEREYVLQHAGSLRWSYAISNFQDVFDEVVIQGRPFLNTMIFVVLSLVLTLTLQPLAAYAMSRFDPPGTWRIILILMATMAFPPMVGLIPQFLILRKLHLLNTFIALVLPVIVNGYLIFLLKGFFDSLPKHLYEAALVDGASELRMFWEITMALSKPILAVVALQTFNHAWLAFLTPLLVCPDESMHVLAVWLYQFQQEAPTPAVFASILVTSIPTLLLFVVTQRTIMRGIAVPAEK